MRKPPPKNRTYSTSHYPSHWYILNMGSSIRPNASGPPPSRHDRGCAFCPQDLIAQQQYREYGYGLAIGEDRAWVAWMNPFPIQPTHFIVAPREHAAQEWIVESTKASAENLVAILDTLFELLSRLPGFIGFHNSPGAGATQPHLHLQFFQRPGYAFPLEEAAACTDPASRSQGTPVAAHHPVLATVFQCSRETVIGAATRWATRWLDEHKRIAPTLSALRRPGEVQPILHRDNTGLKPPVPAIRLRRREHPPRAYRFFARPATFPPSAA